MRLFAYFAALSWSNGHTWGFCQEPGVVRERVLRKWSPGSVPFDWGVGADGRKCREGPLSPCASTEMPTQRSAFRFVWFKGNC